MVKVVFKYRDNYSNGEWRKQECIVNSLAECIEFYGLGIDCQCEIVSIEEIEENKEI